MFQNENKPIILSEEKGYFKSLQYFYNDLKTYAGFSITVFIVHSIILYCGSYIWVNYNGTNETKAFLNSYIYGNFDIDYLFSHNLWWLSLKVHLIVSIVCLINAGFCNFFRITSYFYEVFSVLSRFVLWIMPNFMAAAYFIEDAYIFDYSTSVMICFIPALFMTHPSMMIVQSIIPDLGDIHRFILWCFYRNRVVVAKT